MLHQGLCPTSRDCYRELKNIEDIVAKILGKKMDDRDSRWYLDFDLPLISCLYFHDIHKRANNLRNGMNPSLLKPHLWIK